MLIAAVWVNPAADDEEAVYANNAEATLAALTAGRDGLPSIRAVLARRRAPESILPHMTPEQAAHETRDAFCVRRPGGFMTDAATYARGAELGFEGMDFYVAGRGGVLGDVADVVVAALRVLRARCASEGWERSAPVMLARQAALTGPKAVHAWARGALTGRGRLADASPSLLGRVVRGAGCGGAALRRVAPTARAGRSRRRSRIHRSNALRELRARTTAPRSSPSGSHRSKRSPSAARKCTRLRLDRELPDAAPLHDRWQLAEARTDRMFGRHYRVLNDTRPRRTRRPPGTL